MPAKRRASPAKQAVGGKGLFNTKRGRFQMTLVVPKDWEPYSDDEIADALKRAAEKTYRSPPNLTMWVLLQYLIQTGYLPNRGLGSIHSGSQK